MASYIDPTRKTPEGQNSEKSYSQGLRTSETLTRPALHPAHQSAVHPKPQPRQTEELFSLLQARYG